jgi:uracil-DNA glycosylase
MKVVLVGEAWGRYEAQFAHPLLGPSGRELTLELGTANFAPFMLLLCRKCKRETRFINSRCEHCQEYCWPNEFTLLDHWKKLRSNHSIAVTNVFNCQPPNNDLGCFFGDTVETEMTGWRRTKSPGLHLKAEHFHHIKRLWKELEDLKPNLVILMGNAACWAVLDQTKITALRGTVSWSNRINAKALPTFHPAAVLRQLPMRVSCIADYQKAAREAEFPEIRRPERWITIPSPDSAGIDEIRGWLSRFTGHHTVDIETLRGQISIIGLAGAKDRALSVPFRDAKSDKGHLVDVGRIAKFLGREGGINFWPTPELEFAAWKLMINAIESQSEKTFQNGVYDMSYFIRMGIHPRNARNDTMLWHHSEYIELPKSLGYMESIYCNDIAVKLMGRHDSLKRDE